MPPDGAFVAGVEQEYTSIPPYGASVAGVNKSIQPAGAVELGGRDISLRGPPKMSDCGIS